MRSSLKLSAPVSSPSFFIILEHSNTPSLVVHKIINRRWQVSLVCKKYLGMPCSLPTCNTHLESIPSFPISLLPGFNHQAGSTCVDWRVVTHYVDQSHDHWRSTWRICRALSTLSNGSLLALKLKSRYLKIIILTHDIVTNFSGWISTCLTACQGQVPQARHRRGCPAMPRCSWTVWRLTWNIILEFCYFQA